MTRFAKNDERPAGRFGWALLCTAAVLAGGCDQLPWQDEGEEAESAGGPCEEYAAKICEEAGEQSQSCGTMKTASEIMHPEACEAALANVDHSLQKLEEERAKCDELVSKLCDDIGEDTQSCKMVTEQTQKFPAKRCELMLQQYDKVLADLKKQEARNKPISAEKQAKIASGDAPAFGPDDAKVTIVEFSDFQCPYCSRAANVVEQLREKYGDRVRFVFRQYPLPMHNDARPAAQASLEAEEQGKFWEYHDKLFANQKQLDRDSLEKYAKEVGLDMGSFKKALEEDRYADEIERDMKLGKDVAVRGTPTMFVNGERVSNPTSFEVVSQMVEKELEG